MRSDGSAGRWYVTAITDLKPNWGTGFRRTCPQIGICYQLNDKMTISAFYLRIPDGPSQASKQVFVLFLEKAFEAETKEDSRE